MHVQHATSPLLAPTQALGYSGKGAGCARSSVDTRRAGESHAVRAALEGSLHPRSGGGARGGTKRRGGESSGETPAALAAAAAAACVPPLLPLASRTAAHLAHLRAQATGPHSEGQREDGEERHLLAHNQGGAKRGLHVAGAGAVLQLGGSRAGVDYVGGWHANAAASDVNSKLLVPALCWTGRGREMSAAGQGLTASNTAKDCPQQEACDARRT